MKDRIYLSSLIFALGVCATTQARPQIYPIFPIGGQRGVPFEVEVSGAAFHDVTDVVFECADLTATTRKIETEKDKPQKLIMTVEAGPDVPVGWHQFRLLAKHGISRPWQIFISDVPDILEAPQAEGAPQKVPLPCSIHGKIAEPGEADIYAIEVDEGQQLSFEVQTASGLFLDGHNNFQTPELLVFDTRGSWFDPDRSSIVRCEDYSRFHFTPEREMQTGHLQARFTRRFGESGTYLVRVGEMKGFAGDRYSYLLRIRRGPATWCGRRFVCADPHAWREHLFHMPMDARHLDRIWSRTAHEPEGGREALKVQELSEPTDRGDFDGQPEIELPAFLSGTINPPGDRDRFRFSVEDGAALAFEIRALREERPYFSPRIVIEDIHGETIFTNTYRKIGGDGDDWIKSIEAKTLYTFEKGGEYVLRIQDITSRHGGPDFEYRVFVRKQVPHVGDVTVNAMYVNLQPGGSVTLHVDVHREESFKDVVAVDLLDLPDGVDVLPADRVPPEKGPALPTLDKERFVAKIHSLSVLVVASKDAPVMLRPQTARLVVKPILHGNAGPPIVVKEIPVMIFK